MLGTKFTEKVNDYLSSLGKEELKISPIPSNPEKSKHLETAKMRINGMDIDFVNLRAEDYCENSRIPTMDKERRLSLYAALLLPFRKTLCRDKDKKDKVIKGVVYIFRNSLNLNCSDAEAVVSLHNAAERFMPLIPLNKSTEDITIAEVDSQIELIDVPVDLKFRVLAGLLLREIQGFWHAALLLSMLLCPMDVDTCTSKDAQIEHFELDRRRAALFKTVENEITKLGLEKIWEMKPLLNGKEIISVLELKTGGPLVGLLKKKLVEWQLLHPCGSREECVEWLRETHSKCLK